MQRLENWSTVAARDPFIAPELKTIYIVGDIYDHENQDRFSDSKRITTSKIVKADGYFVSTVTGSKYQLGKPCEKWLEFLRETGYEFDVINPVKGLSLKDDFNNEEDDNEEDDNEN